MLAGTPAEKAGFHAGDVIVKYGKREVQDVNQLIRQFDDMKKQMKMVMNQTRGKKGRFRLPPMR